MHKYGMLLGAPGVWARRKQMVSGYLLVLNVRLRGRPFPGFVYLRVFFFFSLFSFFFLGGNG